jgi:hypothetical protein
MFKFLKNGLKIFPKNLKNFNIFPENVCLIKINNSHFSEKSSKEYMNRHVNDHYVKKANVVIFYLNKYS